MNKNEIIKILKSELNFIEKNYFVEKIGLFGSYSNDTFNSKSDIDLFVTLKKPIGFKFFDLADFLEEKLHNKVDLITKDGLESIRNEKIKKSIESGLIYVN